MLFPSKSNIFSLFENPPMIETCSQKNELIFLFSSIIHYPRDLKTSRLIRSGISSRIQSSRTGALVTPSSKFSQLLLLPPSLQSIRPTFPYPQFLIPFPTTNPYSHNVCRTQSIVGRCPETSILRNCQRCEFNHLIRNTPNYLQILGPRLRSFNCWSQI